MMHLSEQALLALWQAMDDAVYLLDPAPRWWFGAIVALMRSWD